MVARDVRRRLAPSLAIMLYLTGLAGGVAAEPVAPTVSPAPAASAAQSQLWLVNSREAPLCADPAVAPALDFYRYDGQGGWIASNRDGLLASDDPRVPTCFCVHGNRTNRNDAVAESWRLYHRLLRQAPSDRAVRFVIWSWPSDEVAGGNRFDVRVKAARSDTQAFYLAWVIQQVKPQVPVSLIGYSFGARAITGALQILSGDQVAGYTLPNQPRAARTPMRAVLMAAALDSDWLAPCGRNGKALDQLDHLLITRNGCDPVLKRYPLMYQIGGPQSLGFVGPTCGWRLGTDAQKIDLIDVTCPVGKTHAWSAYQRVSELDAYWSTYVFFQAP
ncbi:MAG: hypothetical protein ACYC35_23515 [Pirellulales bacterium]